MFYYYFFLSHFRYHYHKHKTHPSSVKVSAVANRTKSPVSLLSRLTAHSEPVSKAGPREYESWLCSNVTNKLLH